MKHTAIKACALVLAGSLMLSGCASMGSSADVYSASQAQHEETVRMGTVESVRDVTIDSASGQALPYGAIGGGLLGAVAGSAVGQGRGSLISGIIGGIAGAMAGDQVENHFGRERGVEITVRLDDGDLRAVTQSANGAMFRTGERVRLLTGNGITRVIS
jgi:outer membrane lipoprotein SlyB